MVSEHVTDILQGIFSKLSADILVRIVVVESRSESEVDMLKQSTERSVLSVSFFFLTVLLPFLSLTVMADSEMFSLFCLVTRQLLLLTLSCLLFMILHLASDDLVGVMALLLLKASDPLNLVVTDVILVGERVFTLIMSFLLLSLFLSTVLNLVAMGVST